VGASVAAQHLRLADQLLAPLPELRWRAVDLTHLGRDIDQRRHDERLVTIAGALPAGRDLQIGAEDQWSCKETAAAPAASVAPDRCRCPHRPLRVDGAYSRGRTVPCPMGSRPLSSISNSPPAAVGGGFSLDRHDSVFREALLPLSVPSRCSCCYASGRKCWPPSHRSVPVRVYVRSARMGRYWIPHVAKS